MKIRIAVSVGLTCMAFGALPLVGCGDDDDGGVTTTLDSGADTNITPIDSSITDTGSPDTSDGAVPRVPVLAKATSNGSSVALSPDESRVIMANRDKGSVTVFSVVYGGAAPVLAKVVEVDLGATSEPWQVVVDPLGDRAYVVLRQAQKIVRIDDLKTTPKKGPEVAVGSEPTGIALSPKGTRAYVANWVDGTVSGVDTEAMTVVKTINLNAALVATGLLGSGLTARPAMAHPRSIAVTNNANDDETDEFMYVTEYFAQRTAAEAADGLNADTTKEGLVYRVKLSDDTVTTVALAPTANMGFKTIPGVDAGCFPNQLQSITMNGKFAYVVSVCASPRGPVGVRQTNVDCPSGPGATGNAECNASVTINPGETASTPEGVCVAANVNGTNKCNDNGSVKTSTTPHLSVIDTSASPPVEVSSKSLNRVVFDRYIAKAVADDANRRLPLMANDLTFVPGTSIGYLTANGTNAVFRLVFAVDGSLTSVGSDSPLKNFIDLTLTQTQDFANASHGLLPTGLVAGSKNTMFVANDISRNLSVVDLATQAVAGGASPVVVASSARDVSETSKLKGKLFFNTGLGRWSLRGQGWGACQSCHVDGLTDNVTWYFGRGPRQSTSLDGSFSANGAVQRIFNWTAIFDDVADFEGNTRGTSGGVGAIVKDVALAGSSRIDLATAVAAQKHNDLNGSSKLVADTGDLFTLGAGNKSLLGDWADIETYIKGIRSPRGARGLDATKVAAGLVLFSSENCKGCHGGTLWTTSEVFYARTAANAFATTEAFLTAQWMAPTGGNAFPLNTSPTSAVVGNMRLGGSDDQLLCAIRNVGTFNVAESNVGIAELRQNMTTTAQGGTAGSLGYSPPSLLGVAAGGPLLHAGNARTLEALFSDTFKAHHQAISPNFLNVAGNAAQNDINRAALIQFLLSIDDSTTIIPIPAAGATGGVLCAP